MDIKNLEAFVMVAELRSFTRAAEKLSFTQSTVSFQIKQLEEELGAPLFERINRCVTLTNEGQRLLPLSHRILRLSAEAAHISGCEAAPQGVVRIAIAESLAGWQLAGGFDSFHRQYPDIRLKVMSSSSDDMLRALSENEVDIMYTLDRQTFSNKFSVPFKAPVHMRVAASPQHPLAALDSVSIEQLVRYPLLLTEKDMSYRAMLDEILSRHGCESQPLIEIGDTSLICELLRQGVGVSCLPEYTVRPYVERGTLTELNVPDVNIEVWRQVLHLSSKWISPEIQCVIDLFRTE